jgi:hypothetical protein
MGKIEIILCCIAGGFNAIELVLGAFEKGYIPLPITQEH